LFTDLLSLHGINLNFKEILFGFQTVENSDIKIKELKVKRYNAMESDEGPDSDKRLDNGKGVDREQHPFHGSEYNVLPVVDNVSQQLIDNLNPATRAVTEPPFAL